MESIIIWLQVVNCLNHDVEILEVLTKTGKSILVSS